MAPAEETPADTPRDASVPPRVVVKQKPATAPGKSGDRAGRLSAEQRQTGKPAPSAESAEPPERRPRQERRNEPSSDQPRRRPKPASPDSFVGNKPAAGQDAERQFFFAPCPRGLEAELAKELAEIGAGMIQPGSGGVAFVGSQALAWKVNLWSRLAIRVLWRVAEGRYRLEQDLYDAALALDWPAWFDPGRTIAVTTLGKNSPLKSLNFISLKVKDAICDRFRAAWGERPSVDTHAPDIPVLMHLSEERYTLYIDLSGEPLNRRGYRVQPALAPLNETLAAGLLKLAGWRPGIPLYDPMMGGGTILLEAALMALNIAPGIKRHFAFEKLRDFDMVEWQRLRKDAQGNERPREPLPIFGTDIDPDMVRATGLNLGAAGVLECVRIMEGDFLNVDPPTETGIIVTNPPYGVRLSVEGMAELYKGMGDNLKQHFPGWHAYLFSADPELPKGIGLKATRRIPLYNGPLECRLYEYRLVAGGNRERG